MKVVVDANIAAKWLFEEEYSQEAFHILTSYEIIAPSFLLIETGNIIWKKISRGNLPPEYAEETLEKIYGLLNQIVPTLHLFPRPLTLSKTLNHPIYDCIYLATAETYGAPLITADRKFFNCVSQHVDYARMIAWIKDLPEVPA